MHAQHSNSNSTITRGQIADLPNRSHVLNFPAGEHVNHSGDAVAIATVVKGAVKQVASIEAGREQVLAFQFLGDHWIAWPQQDQPHRTIALVPSSVRVVSLPLPDGGQACDGGLVRLVHSVSKLASDRASDLLLTLGRRSAEQKVAQFLIEMDDRIGVPDSEKGRKIVLPMSRADIGDNLGLTIESVSRILSRFAREGLIETEGRQGIYLHAPKQLKCLAG